MGDETIRSALRDIERDMAKLAKAREALLALLDSGQPVVVNTSQGGKSLAGMIHRNAVIEVLIDEQDPIAPKEITKQLHERGHSIKPNVTRSVLQIGKGEYFECIPDKGWKLTQKAREKR